VKGNGEQVKFAEAEQKLAEEGLDEYKAG